MHGLHVAPREEAHAPAGSAPPPVRVRALHNFDDVPAAEAELGGVLGREIKLGLHKGGAGRLLGRGGQREREK